MKKMKKNSFAQSSLSLLLVLTLVITSFTNVNAVAQAAGSPASSLNLPCQNTNLARDYRGSVMTASSEGPNRPAILTNNGVRSGLPRDSWIALGVGNEYLMVDFGQQKNFNTVRIYQAGMRISNYRFEFSNDGHTWTPFHSGSRMLVESQVGAENHYEARVANTMQAQFVRLFSENSNHATTPIAIFEFEVYYLPSENPLSSITFHLYTDDVVLWDAFGTHATGQCEDGRPVIEVDVVPGTPRDTWPNQALLNYVLDDIGHILGVQGADRNPMQPGISFYDCIPGHAAFWGWFEPTDLQRVSPAHGGLRRPTLLSYTCRIEEILQQIEAGNAVSNSGATLDLFGIWSIWGDVDDDNRVTSDDFELTRQYYINQDNPNVTISINRAAADVLSDGRIDAADVELIRQYNMFESDPHINIALGVVPRETIYRIDFYLYTNSFRHWDVFRTYATYRFPANGGWMPLMVIPVPVVPGTPRDTWPNQALLNHVLNDIGHIYRTPSPDSLPGYAFWGWFESTDLQRVGRPAHGGMRRPTLLSYTCRIEEVLQQIEAGNAVFDRETLDLFGIWSLWGDVDDDGWVTSNDVELVRQYVAFSRLEAFNFNFNRTAANVVGGGTLCVEDVEVLRRYNAFGSDPIIHVALGVPRQYTITGETGPRWVATTNPVVVPAGQNYVEITFTLDWEDIPPIPIMAVGFALDFPYRAFISSSATLSCGSSSQSGGVMHVSTHGFSTQSFQLGVGNSNWIPSGPPFMFAGYEGEVEVSVRLGINPEHLQNPGDIISIRVDGLAMAGLPSGEPAYVTVMRAGA